MFIEQLDRPWLDTPLPFQSFYIRSPSEVAWIKDHCAFVLVDSGKSDSTLDFGSYAVREAKPARADSDLLRECLDQMVVRGPSGRPASRAQVEQPAKAPTRPARTLSKFSSWIRPFIARSSPAVAVDELRTDQEIIRQQVAYAEHSYQRAHQVMSGVMNELRAGGELDVPSVEKVILPIIDCVLQSTDAMACVMRMKETDDYTYNHALATSIWAVVFGKSLGFDKPNLEILGMGGLLLDIGKTRIPHELLSKVGPLEPPELAELRRHVEYSVAILRETKGIHPKVEQMVQTHHERHDGSGYPAGLTGNAIPVFGRLAGLVDTYDAMTSLRPYAPAMSTYNVMRVLVDQGDRLFQGELIERFIRVVGIFPTASLVELNSGEVGIVVEQNALRRLRPKVMLVLDAAKQLRTEFPVVDLGEVSAETISPDGLWIVHGLEPGSFGIDPREYYL
jgi:HD-GYP domain-containing protein (c-di-GMP phosphodiesterase class II)